MKRLFGVVSVLVGVVFVSTASSFVYAQTAQPDAKAALTSRLEERRTRLKIKLNPTDSARVKANCVAAQAKIEAIAQKVTTNNEDYQMRYSAFKERVEAVQANYKAQGKDATALDTKVESLRQSYQTYKASFDQLSTSLSDSKAVDCAAEPNGFKGTLTDIREQLKTMQTNRQAVTQQAKVDILATLQTMKGTH